MKRITIKMFIMFLLAWFLPGCNQKDNSVNIYDEGPEIEWVSGTTWTYSYSGGVLSGVNIYKYFDVLDKSGEVQIIIKNKDSNKNVIDTKTGVFEVEEGERYKITVTCKLGSSSSKCYIVFDSPTASSPSELSFTEYSLTIQSFRVDIVVN